MDLILPEIGLIFWTGLSFLILVFLLKKYAWKPILTSVNEREEKIALSLSMAEEAKKEIELLKSSNEELLRQAKIERDEILKEARAEKSKIIELAKNEAKHESEKILANAKQDISTQKIKTISEIKNEIALMAMNIAEQLLKKEMSSETKQKEYVDQLVEDL